METDLTGAAAKATVDMHIADSERLRAVQAEGGVTRVRAASSAGRRWGH